MKVLVTYKDWLKANADWGKPKVGDEVWVCNDDDLCSCTIIELDGDIAVTSANGEDCDGNKVLLDPKISSHILFLYVEVDVEELVFWKKNVTSR